MVTGGSATNRPACQPGRGGGGRSITLTDIETIDNRPYPRTELCPCCGVAPVDVVGPGDTWSMCPSCHLTLAAEVRDTPTLSEMLRMEEEYMRAAMADPTMSDDAICDAVLDVRRRRSRGDPGAGGDT